MNNIKNKKTYLIPFIVVLILLLISIYYIVCITKTYNSKVISDEVQINKINIINNFTKDDNIHFLTKSIKIDNGGDEKSKKDYELVYTYSGENQGKLMIGNYEKTLDSMIEITVSKTIKDIESCPTVIEKYEDLYYQENAYILFEDGTIGKITAEQIYSKNYEIEMLKEYKDIEYFMPLSLTAPNASGGFELYGIDKNGKAIFIDGI